MITNILQWEITQGRRKLRDLIVVRYANRALELDVDIVEFDFVTVN